jgi:hypothetical protein
MKNREQKRQDEASNNQPKRCAKKGGNSSKVLGRSGEYQRMMRDCTKK